MGSAWRGPEHVPEIPSRVGCLIGAVGSAVTMLCGVMILYWRPGLSRYIGDNVKTRRGRGYHAVPLQ